MARAPAQQEGVPGTRGAAGPGQGRHAAAREQHPGHVVRRGRGRGGDPGGDAAAAQDAPAGRGGARAVPVGGEADGDYTGEMRKTRRPHGLEPEETSAGIVE